MATKKVSAKTETAKKPATRKPRAVLKPLKCVAAAAAPVTVDDNLKKLAASRLPATFVKEHNGAWNHEDWLGFLAEIKAKGYEPIDPDRVGLILEDKKAKFLAKK